ncbi:MAG: type II toxin-antitoxin system PemK/MazF family toxin [Chloroflexi bacterium]|nr:type II toxin-antitoxin system PemK/MazF family toxin [Chloroflexota bacterium]MCC6894036.1 type II toxin-antitoxin system PemK/MazF family toxin [Anaerolineae bacterium]
MTTPNLNPKRGEIWEVRFDPSEGDEIRKIRPAVVINIPQAGRMQLRVVVPITGWQPQFVNYFWMTQLSPDVTNGLSKESSADSFQIRSLSLNRFQRKLGTVSELKVREIAAAIVLCVGFKSTP